MRILTPARLGSPETKAVLEGIFRNMPPAPVPATAEPVVPGAFRPEAEGGRRWVAAAGLLAAAAAAYLVFLAVFCALAWIQLRDTRLVAAQWPVAFGLWVAGQLKRIVVSLAGYLPLFFVLLNPLLHLVPRAQPLPVPPGMVPPPAPTTDALRFVWGLAREYAPAIGARLVDMSLTALPSFLYLYAIGSRGWTETWLFLAAVGVAYGFQSRVGLLNDRLASAAAALLLLAVSVEGLDRLRQPVPLPLRPGRAVAAPGVALALSGGGYRAALLHAGVLMALEDLKVPVSHVASVSGGSIVGSYYALGGDPEAFAEAVAAGRFNAKRRLLWPSSLVRLAAPLRIPLTDVTVLPRGWDFNRTDVQREMLQDVLIPGRRRLEASPPPGLPRLMICTTDLWTGQAVGLTGLGIVRHRLPRSMERLETSSGGTEPAEVPVAFDPGAPSIPLAEAVAASGAFPVALPPVRSEDGYLLGDGGLFDNLGLTLLLDAHHLGLEGWTLGPVVVSDGSQLPVSSRATGFRALGSVPDIIYANYSKAPPVPGARYPAPVITLSPGAFVSPLTGEVLEDRVEDAVARAREAFGDGSELGVWARQDRLVEKLSAAIAAFKGTPTLSDQIAPERVRDLLFLGRALVYLQADAMAGAGSSREAGIAREAGDGRDGVRTTEMDGAGGAADHAATSGVGPRGR